jgi:hypothetical protein
LSGWAESDPSSPTQMAKVELEGAFSELRPNGVLESSSYDAKIVHLEDAAFSDRSLQYSHARTTVPREKGDPAAQAGCPKPSRAS